MLTGFHQTPSSFIALPTIAPSAIDIRAPAFVALRPLPTSTGREETEEISSTSSTVVGSPVRWPVAMSASAPKASVSCASSAIVRSATMAGLPCLT